MARLSEMHPALRQRLIVEAQTCPWGLTPDTFLTMLENPPRRDYRGRLVSALRALEALDRAGSAEEIVVDLSPALRQRALDPRRGLPHYIRLLQDLKRAIETQQPRLTVVRAECDEGDAT